MKQRKLLAALLVAVLLCSGCTMVEAVIPGSNGPVSVSQVQNASRGQTPPVLTAEQAKAIALAYLGLEENRITGLKTELEAENGVLCYDVQFHHGRWEYEFQINAQTGQIVSFDRED